MNLPIVIYGAGGFAREVAELIRDINRVERRFELLGFLSDDQTQHGVSLNGVTVLGGVEFLELGAERVQVALGVGSPALKRRLVHQVQDLAAGFPNLVHPTVVRSDSVELGEGVVITAGNILTTNITIGDFAMLNLGCTVGHDCRIGSYATLSPGASVSGHVCIGEGTDIGTGCSVIQGIAIGKWSVVGAGAVVARHLTDNCTAVGVPASVIKTREEGWQLS
jgi:sugar O-acyltransferase (sialic acid O-acetyltransferase NeuD family)